MIAIGFARRRRLAVSAALGVVALCLPLTPAAAQGTPEQQQLCTDDAFRLCSADIPDVQRVTACMVRKKAQLSPGCRSVFRPEPAAAQVPAEPVVRARPGRPVALTPASRAKGKTAAKAPAKGAKAAKKPARKSGG